MLDENGVDTAPQGNTRKRAKGRLDRASQELRRACLIVSDVHQVYAPREPQYGEALKNLITIISMAETMAKDINNHL